MSGSSKLWKMIPTVAVGAAAFTLTTGSAYAFFPPLPVGSDTVSVSPISPATPIIPVSPTIPVTPTIPPTVPPTIPPLVPPASPPPFVPPTTPQPPTEGETEVPTVPEHCTPAGTPQTVPEPATILSGVIGLGILGGLGWKRRNRGQSKS